MPFFIRAGSLTSFPEVARRVGLDPSEHHGARVVWEVLDGTTWVALADGAVRDPTRALTRPGIVVLTPPFLAVITALKAVVLWLTDSRVPLFERTAVAHRLAESDVVLWLRI